MEKVSLIGVGLLGGSLGLALRRRNLSKCVVGFVRRTGSVRECERVGSVHKATQDLEEAVSGADLIVLCTPIAQMRPLVLQMRNVIKAGAVITDVGSVKASVVRDLEPLAARAGSFFIGSHPMAGAERMGSQRPAQTCSSKRFARLRPREGQTRPPSRKSRNSGNRLAAACFGSNLTCTTRW